MSKQIVICVDKQEFNKFYQQIIDYTKKYRNEEPAKPKEFSEGITVVGGYVGKHALMSIRIETWILKGEKKPKDWDGQKMRKLLQE